MKNLPKTVFDAFRTSMLTGADTWIDLVAEDVSLEGPLANAKGKTAFIEVNKTFFSSIQSSEIHTIVEHNDRIITQITTKVLMPSGKTISLEISEWYEIKNNLIQSLKVYFDSHEFRTEMAL